MGAWGDVKGNGSKGSWETMKVIQMFLMSIIVS